MELDHEFTVHRPIDEAYAVLTDVELIAPCLPGAQLQEIEGDVYRGVVKVKVGPILAQFKGQATFVEQDQARHRAVLKAEGRDTGGKGNASALITAQLEAVSPEVTTVAVLTDLTISGKVAQFGRGVLADVSDKLLAQFSDNLNQLLEHPERSAVAPTETAAVATVVETVTETVVETEVVTAASNGDRPAAEAPTIRRIDSPDAEPIELLETAGAPLLKRLIPVLAGVVVLALVLRRLRRR